MDKSVIFKARELCLEAACRLGGMGPRSLVSALESVERSPEAALRCYAAIVGSYQKPRGPAKPERL